MPPPHRRWFPPPAFQLESVYEVQPPATLETAEMMLHQENKFARASSFNSNRKNSRRVPACEVVSVVSNPGNPGRAVSSVLAGGSPSFPLDRGASREIPEQTFASKSGTVGNHRESPGRLARDSRKDVRSKIENRRESSGIARLLARVFRNEVRFKIGCRLPADAARAVPAHKQPVSVVGVDRVVPPLGFDRHVAILSKTADIPARSTGARFADRLEMIFFRPYNLRKSKVKGSLA